MESKSTLAINIRKLRLLKQNITPEELGALLVPKRSGKTIWSWEASRTRPHVDYLQQLCEIFDVSIDYLMGSEKDTTVFKESPYDVVPIPILGSVSAGQATKLIPMSDVCPMPKTIVARHPKAYALLLRGESMNRVFPDRSLLLIDPEQDEPIDNQIFAVNVNKQETTVKKIVMFSDRLELTPESWDGSFTEEVYCHNTAKMKKLSILGRVVWHIPPYTGVY